MAGSAKGRKGASRRWTITWSLLLSLYMSVGVIPSAGATEGCVGPTSTTTPGLALAIDFDGSATVVARAATTSGADVHFCGNWYADIDDGLSITGSIGSDTLTVSAAGASYWSFLGGISIDLLGGDDVVILQGTSSADTINANTDFTSLSNVETLKIEGGGGADTLVGSSSRPTIIEGGADADTLTGGSGAGDTVSYEGDSTGVTVDLSMVAPTAQTSVGDADGDILSGFENVTGGSNVDTLTGNGAANVIIGGAGGDTLNGAGGVDTVSYSTDEVGVAINLTTVAPATQTSSGDAGGDVLSNFENITGGTGDDALTGNGSANVLVGGGGEDTLNGGPGGPDTASYVNDTAGVTIDLGLDTASGGEAAGDALNNIQDLIGGSGPDVLTGDSGANVLTGGPAADTLDGGGGVDTVSYATDTAGVQVDLRSEGQTSSGDADGDQLSNFENITGGGGVDTLTGNTGGNVLVGGAGGDTLLGGDGKDSLVGGLGVDTIFGENGADSLDGTKDGSIDLLRGGDPAAPVKFGDKCLVESQAEKDAVSGCESTVGVKKSR